MYRYISSILTIFLYIYIRITIDLIYVSYVIRCTILYTSRMTDVFWSCCECAHMRTSQYGNRVHWSLSLFVTMTYLRGFGLVALSRYFFVAPWERQSVHLGGTLLSWVEGMILHTDNKKFVRTSAAFCVRCVLMIWRIRVHIYVHIYIYTHLRPHVCRPCIHYVCFSLQHMHFRLYFRHTAPHMSFCCTSNACIWMWPTLLGTNISHQKSLLKMIALFPRWDMLVIWRVTSRCLAIWLHFWLSVLPLLATGRFFVVFHGGLTLDLDWCFK